MFGLDLPLWLLGALGVGKKIISGLFTFFTTKPGVYVGIMLLLISSGWWLHHSGVAQGKREQQQQDIIVEAQARAAAIAGALVKQRFVDQGLITAADHAGFLRGKAQARTITLTKEVTKYVTAETDRAFPVPCGVVRLHDAAALGVAAADLGNPAGLADGDPCSVKASDLAATVIGNYGLYHEAEAQIAGLQDLARTLKAALGDKVIDGKTAQ